MHREAIKNVKPEIFFFFKKGKIRKKERKEENRRKRRKYEIRVNIGKYIVL